MTDKHINLVNDGIFPIIYDINGKKINQDNSTDYDYSGTLQGEGKLIGTPSLFIRTSGCNLRCVWNTNGIINKCDTEYSSFTPEINQTSIKDIIHTVNNNSLNIKHIVITGGEPFVQTNIDDLIIELYNMNYHITVETNATIFNEKSAEYINLISMSPKLSTSEPTEDKLGINFNSDKYNLHKEKRINIPVIQSYIDSCYYIDEYDNVDYNFRKINKDFQLKFVVADISDIDEINSIITQLKGVLPTDIYLMPQGITTEEIKYITQQIIPICLKYGYCFTDRLHIQLFGKKRSV